jgi:hypothetical protein
VTATPIGIGDVLRAIRAIAPDDPTRWTSIADALGFVPVETASGRDRPPVAPGDTAGRADARPREVVLDSAAAQREASLPVLQPVERSGSEARPSFLLHVEPLPVEQPAPASPPALQSLLPAATGPSLLRAMVVVRGEQGPLDVDATVDLVARRRPVERLPLRRSFGTAHDVVVLQDLGPGMDALLEDVDQLIAGLRGVVGHPALRVGGFLGPPTGALAKLGLHRGTVVVVITDLGLSRLAGPDERGWQRWIELADVVARTGARATVLVPWPSERWPAEVAGRLTLVTWDHTTTVADVLRAVRDSA